MLVFQLVNSISVYSITTVFFSLICIVLHKIFNYCKEKANEFKKYQKPIPGPKPLPFIGNALDIDQGYDGALRTMQEKWPEQYGDIHCWFAGPQLNVSICSPELIEVILTSQKLLDKGTDYNWYRDWLGDGLLVSAGDKWKPRRRLLTPAFHFQILDDFVEVFNKQSKVLCTLIDEKLLKDGQEMDVYPLLTNCTLDIICEAAMGVEIDAQSNEKCQYALDVARMTQIIAERTTKPWLASDLLFPLTPTGREQKRLLNRIHSFTDSIIRQRRQRNSVISQSDALAEYDADSLTTRFENGNKKKKSLLDLMLHAASDKSNGLTVEDVRHEIDTFAFGGHDTTSSALLWFLYCMALNPQCQEKAFQEVQEIAEAFDVTDNEFFGAEHLKQMKYVECCIKETLRLYPSAPLIERYCHKDFSLGDYVVPAGSNILILIYALHRNPRHWNEPNLFDPERFMSADQRHPFAYIPFSAGPRNCIGQRFALIEEKVVAAWLLKKFHFALSLANNNIVTPSYQVVLKPLNGLKLVVTKRH